jgi:hypothetical protein
VNVVFSNFETVIEERKRGWDFWHCRTWGRRRTVYENITVVMSIQILQRGRLKRRMGLIVTGCELKNPGAFHLIWCFLQFLMNFKVGAGCNLNLPSKFEARSDYIQDRFPPLCQSRLE